MQAECHAKAMVESVQEAKTAQASMEEDASSTAVALAEELSGAHAMTMGCTAAILLLLVTMLM